MEVKGIGQKIPTKLLPEIRPSNFEEVFDESRKKMMDAQNTSNSRKFSIEGTSINIPSYADPELAKNSQFVKLKEWMDSFHKELHDREVRISIDSTKSVDPCWHLNVTLYECISKLLREISVIQDKSLQGKYLQRVYDWFGKRNNKLKNTSLRHETNIGVNPPKPAPPPQPPLEFNGRKIYEQRMRTLYPEIPPPKDRLQEFKKHELNKSVIETKKNDSLIDISNTKASNIDKTEIEINYSPSPYIPVQSITTINNNKTFAGGLDWAKREKKSSQIEAKSTFQYYEPMDDDEQKIEQMWFSKKNKEISEKRTQEEFYAMLKKWGKAKARLNEEIRRKHENITYGNNFGIRNITKKYASEKKAIGINKTDINIYKEEYEKNSSDDEPEEKTVLDPETNELSPIVKEPKKIKLPEINDLRESSKALIKQEKPAKAKKPEKPIVLEAQKAIYEGDKKKVDYIRKMYGFLINASEDKMDSAANIFVNGPKGMKSLSLYNKDVKRASTVGKKPKIVERHVPATHVGTREQFRLQQVKEINKIKAFLAKEDVPCSVLTLQRAILMPEDFPAIQMKAENFAKPGARLLINPFAVKKKKKGGKKSKKSKK